MKIKSRVIKALLQSLNNVYRLEESFRVATPQTPHSLKRKKVTNIIIYLLVKNQGNHHLPEQISIYLTKYCIRKKMTLRYMMIKNGYFKKMIKSIVDLKHQIESMNDIMDIKRKKTNLILTKSLKYKITPDV